MYEILRFYSFSLSLISSSCTVNLLYSCLLYFTCLIYCTIYETICLLFFYCNDSVPAIRIAELPLEKEETELGCK